MSSQQTPHSSTHTPEQRITSIDVSQEMSQSFLEYAYSVIYARALPDARDGLKPVQRRIIYQMSKMGLTPDKGHVKSSRVVGEVMGKLHPHGDSAIYDALVRLAQPFNLALPLVDGHGNFGSLDDGPAAQRYTEARMAPAALDMVRNLDEDVVDFVPNYDNQFMQPSVLPSGFPQLLVNGASGIAVGMATNIAPHNLGEVIAGACYLLDNPDATIDDLMRYIPGPDLPCGGVIVGLDGIRDAYATGRGTFKTRAKISIDRISARKRGIIVTQLPYMVGPERVIEKIKEAVTKGRIKGISAVTNLTDRDHDLRLVIEVKNGFNPEAVAEQLFKHTPMEDSFGINAVALVDGQPRTLSLKEMLDVFLRHRMAIIQRRSQFQLAKAQERLHLVDGLMVAVLNIDDVIHIVRSSEDSSEAKQRLMTVFDLSELQAEHILSLRLRRLTKLARIELESERDELARTIDYLNDLLAHEEKRKDVVREEMQAVAARHAWPRRTILQETSATLPTVAQGLPDAPAAASTSPSAKRGATAPLEIPDEPCQVLLSSSGLVARMVGHDTIPSTGERGPHDALRSIVDTSTRSTIGAIDTHGFIHRLDVVDLPSLPRTATRPSLNGCLPVMAFLDCDYPIVGLVSLDPKCAPIGIITEEGVVKRTRYDHPKNQESWMVISLTPSDRVVAAAHCPDEAEVVFVSSAANLLRTPADKIRPQGRNGAGIAGMKLTDNARVIAGAFVIDCDSSVVATVAAASSSLPGTGQTSIKVSPLHLFPSKGRGTQGVRAQRFLRGEDILEVAGVISNPAHALDAQGLPVNVPQTDERRDGSGTPVTTQIASFG
ncbi:MAG: DNA topoisomerase IV subunit A [Actinomycetaceae bacterium]|nr:DNA topoisomerase IV subunit A [Actinomycetaceae bacterium]